MFDQLCGVILSKAAQLDAHRHSVKPKKSLLIKYQQELNTYYKHCNDEAAKLGIPVFRVPPLPLLRIITSPLQLMIPHYTKKSHYSQTPTRY
jgi:hypothetical protein